MSKPDSSKGSDNDDDHTTLKKKSDKTSKRIIIDDYEDNDNDNELNVNIEPQQWLQLQWEARSNWLRIMLIHIQIHTLNHTQMQGCMHTQDTNTRIYSI